MTMRSTLVMLTSLLLLTILGCSTTPTEQPQPARLTFSADRYPAVFEAAAQTLRSQGYRIARRDYRFGTITTYPKEAATRAEFWIDDATTRPQGRADTLNAQQRTITVRVEQPGEEPGYALTVEVQIQRLQRPERYLTHSAGTQITSTYSAVPTHLSDRGIAGPYAQDLERDPLLERRLLEAIKAAVKSDTPQEVGLKPRSELLNRQIELTRSVLESLSHDPLTEQQRQESPELAKLDRFQRAQDFQKLNDLLNGLREKYPDDNEVIDLQARTQTAFVDFQRNEAND